MAYRPVVHGFPDSAWRLGQGGCGIHRHVSVDQFLGDGLAESLPDASQYVLGGRVLREPEILNGTGNVRDPDLAYRRRA